MASIISEHLSYEAASDIRILMRDFKKLLKVMTIYPEDNPLPTKMRGSFGSRFVEVVDEFNGLVFTIRPNEIFYNREVVFTDSGTEDVLAADFYDAGIIHLEFREGLSVEEFDYFLEILKMYYKDKSLDSDLVSLLWQEQFVNIKFKTVEDIAFGDSENDLFITNMYPNYEINVGPNSEIDYNQIILDEENTQGQENAALGASSASPQTVQDAEKMGLSLETPPGAGHSIEQLFSDSFTMADEEKREIRRRVEENRQFDPYRSTTRILDEILDFWDEHRPFSETVSICEKILDELLNKGNFAVAADFVHGLRQKEDSLVSTKPTYAERLAGFRLRAGDADRIRQLTDIINRQEKIDTNSIEIYIDSLGYESLVHITGMLGKLNSREARLMICDYLAGRGKDHLNIIANGLRDKHWYVIRNAVMILGKIGGDHVLKYLAGTVEHPDPRVREETIRALSNCSSDSAVELMFRFLKDPDGELRLSALNYLARMGGRRPFEMVRDIVHSSSFASYPLDEQEHFIIVYSRLGGAEVLGFLASIIGSFSLLNAGWKARYRHMALKALAHNTSDEAEKLIMKYTRSRRQWLRQAAVAALEQRRKIIYQSEDSR